MMHSFRKLLLCALGATFFVAACGQSGPLYLPGNPSEVQAPEPAPAPAPIVDDEDDDDDERS
jgi:predicted small lipoprotein YifL